MKRSIPITTLFLDIGGVLLSNGWDHHARLRAAANFHLEFVEMDHRHHLNFATYEEGRVTLEEYLTRTVFYQDRAFTRNQFWDFMCAQSHSYPEMIKMIVGLKARYGLKIAVVSNEARELNAYRIAEFKLTEFVDVFISSCYVHARKPDTEMFRLALDISQATTEQAIFIDNTPMFVQIAEEFGIRSIHHVDCKSTGAKLAAFGLQTEEGIVHETC